MHRFVLLGALLIAQQVTPQCGNSSSGSSDQNTTPITVQVGPSGNSVNTPLASVTICPPGQTSGCQTINGVALDTGSSGLRVLASALNVPLTTQTTPAGAAVEECFPFQDGYTWGPVAAADLTIGSKQAKQVPIQIIGAAGTPPAPASCTSNGLAVEDTVDSLGSNGVLGIGVFRQDCGFGCSLSGASNPGLYYACGSSGCTVMAASLTAQLQNPVWMFPDDNNGVVIQFPNAATPGQGSLAGSLTFGIGTQSNNALGSAAVFTLDANGNFTTTFSGTSSTGFIDSGSNGLSFLDTSTTRLPLCSDNADFYCPAATTSLSATNLGTNGRTSTVSFSIANASALPNLAVLPQLGGPFPGDFDWGLPFFFGRTVFTAIEGQSTAGGTGPYFAY